MGLHRSFSILSTRGLGVYRVTPARASSLLEGGPRRAAAGRNLDFFVPMDNYVDTFAECG